jgi:hypothetical protein
VIVIELSVFELVGAQPDNPYAETDVIVPPHIVSTPGICDPTNPHPGATVGSVGIGNVEVGDARLHPATPSHGFAEPTVRFHVVR